MAVLDIDTSDAGELMDSYQAFAPGEYVLYMETSDVVDTKAGNGKYLKCVFVVSEGHMKDRKIFQNFNFWNQNQTAVDIAKAQWRALCEATVGQSNAPGNDSASLHFKPFIGEVTVRPPSADGKFPASNEISFKKGKIRPVSSGPVAVQQVAQPPMQQAQAAPQAAVQASPIATGNRPAWAKR